jgi:hypothetical protein
MKITYEIPTLRSSKPDSNKHQSNCRFADSKLLVAAGISNEGYTNTFELIDIKQSSEAWMGINQLPKTMDTPMAGYLNSSIPLVCGI